MSLFSTIIILFLIMDPIGNLEAFRQTMKAVPHRKQQMVLLREMGFALILMLFFNAIGEFIFSFLGITEVAVKLSIGLILFLSAVKIIFAGKDHPRRNLPSGEPFFVPLATPLIAGPALLATIMLFAHVLPELWLMGVAILIAWLAACVVIFSSKAIFHLLGESGVRACESLFGMILVMLAIQRFMEGVKQFMAANG